MNPFILLETNTHQLYYGIVVENVNFRNKISQCLIFQNAEKSFKFKKFSTRFR